MIRRSGLVALTASLGVLGSPAWAEIDRPAQLDMANAVGLAYTRIPPPVVKRACLVDTGVAANADTGRVVARFAIDGGTGEDSDTATRHGTSMAMHMAAEANRHGLVGVWPGGEIVSYRVTRERREVRFADYTRAISACAEHASVGVINISLVGSSSATAEEKLRLGDVVTDARGQGIVVVAAAGNDGGKVGSPADEPGVLTVAAGGGDGTTCPFASQGPEVDLVAPGCGLDGASPFDLEPLAAEGSSYAAAMTSQVIAALRSYRPQLGVPEIEAALTQGGRRLDVDGLFRGEGLGHVLDDGLIAAPARPLPLRKARFSRPRPQTFRSARRCRRAHEFIGRRCGKARRAYRQVGRWLLVRVSNLPTGAQLEVRVLRPRRPDGTIRSAIQARRRSTSVRVRRPRRWRRLALRFVPAEGVSTLASPAVFIPRR